VDLTRLNPTYHCLMLADGMHLIFIQLSVDMVLKTSSTKPALIKLFTPAVKHCLIILIHAGFGVYLS